MVETEMSIQSEKSLTKTASSYSKNIINLFNN